MAKRASKVTAHTMDSAIEQAIKEGDARMMRTLADQIALAVFAAWVSEIYSLGNGTFSHDRIVAQIMFRAGGLAAFMVSHD